MWSNGKLEEGIHKPIQSGGVVMEIRWKLHCPVVVTHIEKVKEKEELENLSKCGKFSFYVIVDYLHMKEIFTYPKNIK